MTRFGVHIGLQDTTPAAVLELAMAAEERGFDWVSVWDHFRSSSPADGGSLDAVAMHAALATVTTRVRVGVLVYCVAYRSPGVLASAAATIDLLSGGRVDIGLGAGWSVREFEAFGIPFETPSTRLDLLEESVQAVRSLLHAGHADMAGEHIRLMDARVAPRPEQPAMPVWVGGTGERRTLPIVARLADGWNAPFLSSDEFTRKRTVLHRHCADAARDPAAVRCAANVGHARDDDALHHHFRSLGDTAQVTAPAVLRGRGDELRDGVGRYVEAGADQVNLAMRAPFDYRGLDLFADAVLG